MDSCLSSFHFFSCLFRSFRFEPERVEYVVVFETIVQDSVDPGPSKPRQLAQSRLKGRNRGLQARSAHGQVKMQIDALVPPKRGEAFFPELVALGEIRLVDVHKNKLVRVRSLLVWWLSRLLSRFRVEPLTSFVDPVK